IQVLDDLLYLWKEKRDLQEIERFQIYNTNSLELPRKVLFYNEQLTGTDQRLDEAWEVKSNGAATFHFVVGNQPYVNRGVVTDAPIYSPIPFYRYVLSVYINTFQLFLNLTTSDAAPQVVV